MVDVCSETDIRGFLTYVVPMLVALFPAASSVYFML